MAKILIIDDSIVARMSVKSCIPRDEGHELAEAKDGLSGLEMFRSLRPDVTFLDITMPDKNGLEVLEELRRDFPGAAFIMLTADVQKQSLEKAYSLGALSTIKKPPVKEVVQAELRKALAATEVSNG